MKITLNVKNMKETYKHAKKDMPKVWETFYTMYMMGFITSEEWNKFYDTCKDWYYEEENDWVLDGRGLAVVIFM